MCQRCQVAKEEIWAEIRDLMDYASGPLSNVLREQIAERTEDLDPIAEMFGVNPKWDEMTEMLRCIMIAQRLAFVASYSDSHMHGQPPSLILGSWAGDLMTRELHALAKAEEDGTIEEDRLPLDVFRMVMGDLISDGHGA